MIADRYHYSKLSVEEKEIYNLLYKGVSSHKKEVWIPGSFLTQDSRTCESDYFFSEIEPLLGIGESETHS